MYRVASADCLEVDRLLVPDQIGESAAISPFAWGVTFSGSPAEGRSRRLPLAFARFEFAVGGATDGGARSQFGPVEGEAGTDPRPHAAVGAQQPSSFGASR